MRIAMSKAQQLCDQMRDELNAGIEFNKRMFVVPMANDDNGRFSHVEVRYTKVLCSGSISDVSRWIGGFRAGLVFSGAAPVEVPAQRVCWIFEWEGGGFNTVIAATKDEALTLAGKISSTLVPNVDSLRPHKSEPGDKWGRDVIEIRYSGMCD